MRHLLFSILLGTLCTAAFAAAQSPLQDQCYTCHAALGDKASELFKSDIHFKKGLSCAACHGGDAKAEEMELAMRKESGFIGVPKGDDVSKTCARCHSDPDVMQQYGSGLPVHQAALLQTSVHGKLSVSGKERLLQCTTCHNAHGIVSVKDSRSPVHSLNVVRTCGKCHSNATYMRAYSTTLAVDQVEKYRTSVHGIRNAKGDANVAECTSCHGGHDIRPASDVKSRVYATNLPATCARCHNDVAYMKSYNIPTDQFAKYSKSVHGIALLEKHDLAAPACNDCHGNHGATPPGIESISKVCGSCHALNADLFSSSPHKKAFDAQKLPECETCHGNHEIIAATDRLLGIGQNAVCGRCHTEQKNAKGYAAAKVMRELSDSLDAMERNAIALAEEAEQKGMEISEAKFKLRDVRQARLEARTTVHAFDADKFREVANKGFATASFVEEEARREIDEYYFRRIGLGFATFIITILVISLYLFIRRIEQRNSWAGIKTNSD